MEDFEDESRQSFLRSGLKASRYDARRRKWSTIWIITITLAVISTSSCVILLAYIFSITGSDLRAEELNYPRFSTIQRQFTGGLKYDSDGKLFRDDSNESKPYVGNSSVVADAWRMYDAVQNVELNPSEVNIDGLFIDERNNIITIPDVFHQLHCLNQIRIALYDPEYNKNIDVKRRMHVDHCIDYLRQNIECRADLTPLEVFYSEPAQRMMVNFEGGHTCRDFDAVLIWAWEHHATHVKIH